MTTRVVGGGSPGLSTMLKAALPIVPGLNLVPGIAKKGGPLPDLTLTRQDVAIDTDHVAAYAEVCGFPTRQHLPLTYPHMLAFGLHMAIMTDASFPYPAIGTVHLANSITQHREIGFGERLGVSVHAADLRPHAKGKVFDLVTTITSGGQARPKSSDVSSASGGSVGETVWESTSEYLRVGRGDPDASPEREPLELVPAGPVSWKLPADLGRRYAAVSGDHNPIHLYPLTAKAFGFQRQIAHGMWTKARCVAALDNRIPASASVLVEFKKPVFLPGLVAFGSRVDGGSAEFSLTRPKDGAPHLVGRVTPV